MNEFIKISDRQKCSGCREWASREKPAPKKPASMAIQGLFDCEEHVVGELIPRD
jgi:hypothetical protein